MGRYLVTGGAGFIGSHIAERLLLEGHFVRVLDNLATGRRENIALLTSIAPPGRFDWMEGDIRSAETCFRACDGTEVVFHEAALASVPRSMQHPADTTAVNVLGFLNVLVAARSAGIRRLVFASSSSVYGDSPTLPKHEAMPLAPLSPYAASKVAGELYAQVFSKSLGLETICLRYFNVFGPRQDPNSQYAAVVPRFIRAALTGARPVVFGDGGQTRDFTYIDNVVEANLLAAACETAKGESINIACGDRYSLLDLIKSIYASAGGSPDPDFQSPRPGDVRHSQASIELAKKHLGFQPRIGFREGVTRTVEYFRSHP